MSQDHPPAATTSAATPQRSDSPMIAAWECGRILGRWQFFAIQEWFGLPSATAHREQASQQLELQVRALVGPDERDELQQAIRDWERDWQATLNIEALVELRLDAREQLKRLEIDGADQRAEIQKLLAPLDEILHQVRTIVRNRLDSIGQSAMSLGEWLEQGRFPPQVAFVLPGWTEASTEELRIEATDADPVWGSSAGQSLEFKLANRFYSSDELPPPSGWLQGLQQRWQELSSVTTGFALPECADVVNATELSEFMVSVGSVFHQTVQAAEARAACNENNSNPTPGYLGLIMDREPMILRRQGISASVEFISTPLLWRILDILVRKRGGFANRSELRDAWQESEDRSNRTMDNQLSNLRTKLRSLRIEMQNNRGVGWRLRNFANDDA